MSERVDGAAARVAGNTWLVLSSRIFAAFGVPIALGMFWRAIEAQQDMTDRLVALSETMAVVEYRMGQREIISDTIETRLQAIELNRYTERDADRDLAVINNRLDRLDTRITALERP